jgi:beta-lactamase class A
MSMPDTAHSPTITDWRPLATRLAAIPDGMRLALAARHLGSGSTLDHDADRPVTAASTIKTLILTAVARALDAGDLALDTEIEVRDDWRIGGSGVVNWLHRGITLTVGDLAWLMIAISDNTTSNALIETVGLKTIQETATELGVPSLHLGRRFYGYLPEGETNVNTVTARGLTDLLTAIWRDEVASPERCAWMRTLHADQQHRDRLPRRLPEGVSYAGKTGTLDGISHDVGVIAGPGGEIVVSALLESECGKYEDNAFLGDIGAAVAEIVS